MGSTKELAEAPGRGLRASEEVLSGLGEHLASPLQAPPAGFPGQGGEQKEAGGSLRPAGPGCHLYRGHSHLRLWLAQEAGTRGGDARPRAFGGWPERWLRGLEDREVAADFAAAAENTRSPWLWSSRPLPSDPEDQEAGRGGGAASAAQLCHQQAVGTRWRRPAVPLPAGAGTAAWGWNGAGVGGRRSQRWGQALGPALEETRSLGTTLGTRNNTLLPVGAHWEDSCPLGSPTP